MQKGKERYEDWVEDKRQGNGIKEDRARNRLRILEKDPGGR